MRDIKYIVLHCTATDQDAKPSAIVKYWKRKGWKHTGYHFLIDKDGEVFHLQDIKIPSNGVRGYNKYSIHVSYIGGKDVDDRTFKQHIALEAIVKTLHAAFPEAEIKGHRDFPKVAKSCPRFDVVEWIKEIEL